jgi:hypothetical protein
MSYVKTDALLAVIVIIAGACSQPTNADVPRISYSKSELVLGSFHDDLRLAPSIIVDTSNAQAIRLLHITLTSSTDFVALAKQNEYNFSIDGRMCDERSRRIIGGSLYASGEVVSPYFSRPDLPASSSYEYEIFVPVRVNEPSAEAYDLLDSDGDICLRVGGGRMDGAKFQSNEIRIPRLKAS